MRLLLVAQNFQIGGIQRSLLYLLRELVKVPKVQVDLFVFGEGPLLEEVPKEITLLRGNLPLCLVSTPFSEVVRSGSIARVIGRLLCMCAVRLTGPERFYRTLFRQHPNQKRYDVAISYFNDVPHAYFNQGTNLYVERFVSAQRKLAWIHTDPIEAGFDQQFSLNRYRRFDRIVCVSKAVQERCNQLLPPLRGKTCVMYNLFPMEEIRRKALQFVPFSRQSGRLELVTVGRMENASKQIDLALQVCARLKKRGMKHFVWHMVGGGPHLRANQALAGRLGISELVQFTGSVANPYPYLLHSDLLVLTSRYEGYPMVVGEALALGTPVLSTRYAAAAEQIADGINGVLTGRTADDVERELWHLLSDSARLDRMRENLKTQKGTNEVALAQLKALLTAENGG